MSLNPPVEPPKRRRLLFGIGTSSLILLIGLGVFARNGWLPHTDSLSGKKTGWFGKELPKNASSVWNPWAAPLPGGTPQLNKEYIYAGSRLLAVEDANAGASPTPSPTPFGYESDLAPRTTGDGVVLATDKTIVQRLVVGLDCQTPGTNEAQRADASPRSTLGDGIITSSDVVQAQRYATALDPLTAAGGPIGQDNCGGGGSYADGGGDDKPESDSSISVPTSREIRVQNVGGVRGQTITIPVFMKLDRDEMAVSFTLEYDSAKLSNPRLSLTGDLPASTVLTVNTGRPGKIGILVDALTPFSTTPRELRIVFVTFDIRNTALTGSSQVRLTSSLARQSVADTTAILLQANYTNGSISISP